MLPQRPERLLEHETVSPIRTHLLERAIQSAVRQLEVKLRPLDCREGRMVAMACVGV
jgi:hypothetical protein